LASCGVSKIPKCPRRPRKIIIGLYHLCIGNNDKFDDGVHTEGGIVTKAVRNKRGWDF